MTVEENSTAAAAAAEAAAGTGQGPCQADRPVEGKEDSVRRQSWAGAGPASVTSSRQGFEEQSVATLSPRRTPRADNPDRE